MKWRVQFMVLLGAVAVSVAPWRAGVAETDAQNLVNEMLAASQATASTNLRVSLISVTNGLANLLLTNTQNGRFYEILSKEHLNDMAWSAAGLVPATGPSTPVSVPLGAPTNPMFLRAMSRQPTNGAVWVTLQAGCTNLSASVNRVSQAYSISGGSVVEIPGPVVSFNAGYDYSDGGTWDIPWPPQNVVAVNGFTGSLTNFCASYTPLSSLDLHGLTGLQEIECFSCDQLATVNVTNCHNLTRACFEACSIGGVLDFTGDTNLLDIRGAHNNYTNVVFGGAGRKVWHLCTHDNPLNRNLVLTNFFSLQEWLVWNANQTGDVTRVTMPSTNLTDVELGDNRYKFADFTGQTKLRLLFIENNRLTNLVIKGCTNLIDVKAPGNLLTTAALDAILTTLYNAKKTNGNLDLSGNAHAPSATGRTTATNLQTKLHWTVKI